MIHIVTDSTCDIPRAEQKALGLRVLPLTVNFGTRVYRDGLDLEPRAFYEMLEKAAKLPTTSQINPGAFQDLFEDLTANGDYVVGLFLSSDLSGTAHSAMIAANAVCPERIFVVDSRSVSLGLGILVREAVRLRDASQLDAAQLAKHLQKLALRIRVYSVVDTLKYLKLGGRLSVGSAAIGGLLGIQPVIRVYGGVVEAVGKIRGEKAGMKFLEQKLKAHPPALNLPIGLGHAAAREKLERYTQHLKPILRGGVLHAGWIGTVIGAHAGPGVVGIAYFEKEAAAN